VKEMRALVEVAKGPKFEPEIVTIAHDVKGRLVTETELTKGVS
jgi:hypothetical protein